MGVEVSPLHARRFKLLTVGQPVCGERRGQPLAASVFRGSPLKSALFSPWPSPPLAALPRAFAVAVPGRQPVSGLAL
ncbi:unnamed protein product [Ixodes pacificus]